ncbi:MAG: hypothetical protein VW362_10345 [Candidatus Nanopelagicales bacterium]
MSRPEDRTIGRLPPALQIKHGYLDETLQAATVVGGVLQIKTATMSVWAFDEGGVWSDTGGNIEVSNIDEGDAAAENTRLAVYWDNTLLRWFPLDLSCSPTALPIGGS